jgi:cytochrome c oxidase cbb3-type subunit 3
MPGGSPALHFEPSVTATPAAGGAAGSTFSGEVFKICCTNMVELRKIVRGAPLFLASMLLFWTFALAAGLASQDSKPAVAANQAARVETSVADGRQVFESRCAGCHGLDGRGGERAPDIATTARTQGRGDEELSRIIEKGVPGTGMPAFGSMGPADVANVVAYLRLLQGKRGPAKLPGNAKNGRAVFYGKAGCSECHMVAGSGGFIATNLTAYAGTHAVEEVRNAITKPGAAGRLGGKMTVTTRDGQRVFGIARNEDNFSIQLQTLDGGYHLFLKSDVEKFERQHDSLMPSNYGSTLSATELNDLISFLMRAAQDAKADAGPNQKPAGDEEEQ